MVDVNHEIAYIIDFGNVFNFQEQLLKQLEVCPERPKMMLGLLKRKWGR